MSDKIKEINNGIVKPFTREKVNAYPHEGELCDRILKLIYEYDGQISTVSIAGVLDVVKKEILDM